MLENPRKLVLRDCRVAILPRIKNGYLEYSVIYDVDLELDGYRFLTPISDTVNHIRCDNFIVTAGFFNGLYLGGHEYNILSSAVVVDRKSNRGRIVGVHKDCHGSVVFIDTTTLGEEDLLKAMSSNKEEIKVLWMPSTLDEVYKHYRDYKMFPIERLEKLGLLEPKVILAGIGWLTSWEEEYIKNSSAWIAYSVRYHLLRKTRGLLPVKSIIDNTMLSSYYSNSAPEDLFVESSFLYILNNSVFGGDELRPLEAVKLLHNGWRLCYSSLEIPEIPWRTGLQLIGLPLMNQTENRDDIDYLLETLFLNPSRLGRIIMIRAEKMLVKE